MKIVFFLLWQKVELISNKIRECIVDTDFSIKEARISRKKATKKGKEGPTTPKSHHRIFTYYPALDKIEFSINIKIGQ